MTGIVEAFPYSEREERRLALQSHLLSTLSGCFLRSAGIHQGMAVLDVGCATGGFTFLVASIVGEEGHVVALDRCNDALKAASERSSSLGLDNVEFVCADLHKASHVRRFDAIVGRFILAYVAAPEAAVRALVPLLHDGGVMAFQEWDHSRLPDAYPRIPQFDRLNEFVIRTLRAIGVRTQMAQPLRAALSAVSKTRPEIISYSYLTADVDGLLSYLLDTVWALEGPSRAFSAREFEEMTSGAFLEQLRTEASANQAILGLSPIVGAWTRIV